MRKDYIERIKSDENLNWIFTKKDEEMYLVATDDLDSIMSCLLILQYRPCWTLSGFLDYRDGLYHDSWLSDEMTQDNTIWIDCSSIKQGEKCVSNHLSSIDGKVHNSCDINLNSIDGNYRDKSYFEKYNLSTFLLLSSIFAEEGYLIDDKVGRVLALCIDGAYVPYFQPDSYKDAGVQKRYLNDVLELGDIYEIQREMEKKDFIDLVNKLNLKSKVYITEEGIRPFMDVDLTMLCKYLNIDIDLSVLDGIYGLIKSSTSINKTVNYMRGKDLQNSKINSYCITGQNNVSFSYWVD